MNQLKLETFKHTCKLCGTTTCEDCGWKRQQMVNPELAFDYWGYRVPPVCHRCGGKMSNFKSVVHRTYGTILNCLLVLEEFYSKIELSDYEHKILEEYSNPPWKKP